MIDQRTESLMFQVEHQDEILRTRGVVLEAARQFLDCPVLSSLLPDNVRKAVEQAVEGESPERIAPLIRNLASEYVEAGLSEAFWALVDASNFLQDAMGSGWPYMTQQRRRSSLSCAVLEAIWVKNAIPC